ncbi:MarR family winged helix-turn-helix transcriptional regulator [Apilactobacillus xinyiensis]|jgi:DNA-binding MarR family transcriptional regulator|uniref:MarR family winged helix-turn-helix transcriptional regulator n=1 Tax=Apilactobacillus xinyiensis TaxID=2841032 RepID=A0ABT0I0Q8_9LACO|nr:MarR family winged helix-turn-helix transcriptional regulator [Apilactobacillus xinyiensis]MCK8624408.1 MarR family winged helix-turn-helix transcriptional regulator [Apilactobacillus xinyiensis]MCL0312001.1 MarR family winged helix-turn-helix transcriptional regulator [Apilactobacillus xinyiensis]MCL0318725.1 MarR family winged helix-turn-helix transcriptional regulator [Apilactobacillus xinyiensis]MCL0329601.1 MarR family winged helix-turn-helix transcriptional regulator [Apilactobacillus 
MRNNFGMLLKIACTQMVKRFDAFAHEYGLTSTQMSVIDFLSHRQDVETFQKDIEEEFYIQKSTASVLLKRMEKHNLILRTASSKDSRKKQVTLTNNAMALQKVISDYMNDTQIAFEKHFSDEEIKLLNRSMHKLIKFEKGKL